MGFLALPVQAPILIVLLRHNNEEAPPLKTPSTFELPLATAWRCVLVRFLTIALTCPCVVWLLGRGVSRMGFLRKPAVQAPIFKLEIVLLRHNSEEAPPPKTPRNI